MKFKNIITALFVMLAAFAGYSCTEDADVVALETELSLSSTYFGTTQEGGELTVSISANAEWSISQSAETDWMSIDTTSGTGDGEFTISVDTNATVSAREVTIIVTCEESSEIVLVSQEMGDEVLTVSFDSVLVDSVIAITCEAATHKITVTANTIWDASVSYESGHDAWVTMSTQTSSGETDIDIDVTENPFVTPRTATIKFLTSSNTTYTYDIVQSDGSATLSLVELDTFSGVESSKWVTITSNNSWTVDAPSVDWVTIATNTGDSDVKGNGNGTFQVSVTDNPTAKARTATLYVDYGGSEKAEVVVNQSGATSTLVVADPQYADFDSDGGSVTFSVSSNDTWSVVIPDDYSSAFSVSYGANGAYDSTFTVTAAKNTSSSIDTKIQVVCDEDETVYVNIPVTQTSAADDAKLNVTVSGNDSVAAAGTTLAVTVDGTESWSASIEYDGTNYYDANFLSLSAASGDAGADFTITVAKNGNQVARFGTVVVTSASGVERLISVSQAAGALTWSTYFSDYSQNNRVPAAGAVVPYVVTTNADSWYIVDWSDWVLFNDGTYAYDQTIDMTIEENMTFSNRSATIYVNTITGLSSGNKNFTVYQAASTGSLSLSEVEGNAFDTASDLIEVENVGGSITLKVKSNVEYSISYEYESSNEFNDWITLTSQYDDALDYVDICKFTVAESENYTALTEINSVIDTGYIVIKPTSSSYSSLGEIKIKVTLGAFMAQDPTYAVSKLSSTELVVEIENTKFKSDALPSASNFSVKYTNDYASSGSTSGTLAVSSVALDADNLSKLILTVDEMYNTDEVTITYTGSGITLANTKTFDFTSGVIGTDYIEFLNADFETEGEDENFYVSENAIGRDSALTHSDGTASETLYHYANPYVDDINGSAYCMYNEGTDNSSAACLVLCSDAFETVPFNDITLTFSIKVCILEYPYDTITTSSGFSLAFNQSGSSSTQTGGNSYWTPTWSWVTIAQTAAGVWKQLSGTVVQTDSGVDVSFTDMCLTMRYNTLKNGFLFDDITFGNAEPRP